MVMEKSLLVRPSDHAWLKATVANFYLPDVVLVVEQLISADADMNSGLVLLKDFTILPVHLATPGSGIIRIGAGARSGAPWLQGVKPSFLCPSQSISTFCCLLRLQILRYVYVCTIVYIASAYFLFLACWRAREADSVQGRKIYIHRATCMHMHHNGADWDYRPVSMS